MEIIRLDTLALDSNSYTDEKLQEYFSDLVYTCKIKDEQSIKISLLFEHKSYPVKHPHLQLLRYMLNIWETDVKQNKIPQVIIPMIIYHGRSKWKAKDFKEYFHTDIKHFKFYIPSFEYLLTDLSSYTDAQIREGTFKRAALEIGLLIQKNIFDEKKLIVHLKDIINIGKLYYREEGGLKFLESVLRYILFTTEIGIDETLESIEIQDERIRETFMTTAEKLIEQGLEKGKDAERKEIALKLLEEKTELDFITRITGYSIEELKKLKQ